MENGNTVDRSTLHIIGCGGAGINIAYDIVPKLKTLGNSFSKIDVRMLDTTDKTIQAYPEYSKVFTKVVSNRLTVEELDGTGGERKDASLAKDINEAVIKYVDEKALPNGKKDYYVIVFSGSGGTGSLVSPLLARAMLSKGYIVIPVMVGDSSNLLSINNTINTFSSLQGIAKQTKTAVSCIYYNNAFNGTVTPKHEMEVNSKITKMLSIISLMVSGTIRNIDNQDMRNFFIPSSYKTFNIGSGIYNLGVSIGSLDDSNAILARTLLSSKEDDMEISIPLKHNKTGFVNEETKDMFQYPLYLTVRANALNEEVVALQEEIEELERNSKYRGFDGLDEADELDDLGLSL